MSEQKTPLRTPLFAAHQKLGGKLIEFGGWEMPVHYSSIRDEHLAVRRAGGLFDICHMGEFLVSGSGASGFLNGVLTNNVLRLSVGEGQYTLACQETGGVVDDLYLYRIADEEFLLVVNASRAAADLAWLQSQHKAYSEGAERDEVVIRDRSGDLGAVALQGPRVREFIDDCFPEKFFGGAGVAKASELKKNQISLARWQGSQVYIGCTGYTGEDGFEIIAPQEQLEDIWDRLLAVGHSRCLQPAGLGARDTLRTEVCYPLYGHELNEQTTPIEAGLGFFVSFDKGDFVGRNVLAEQKEKGPSRRCVAFRMEGKSAPPRPGYAIWGTGPGAVQVGEVGSGTQSPTLNVGIGLALVPSDLAKAGNALEIEIRNRRMPATIVRKPFYKRA
jgi:aminomethyltransferase